VRDTKPYPPEELEPWDFVPDKKRRKRIRKPTLASALKAADKAGKAVAGATIKPDGSVALEFGNADAPICQAHNANPWDRVLQ
jgi:hypothetical protein